MRATHWLDLDKNHKDWQDGQPSFFEMVDDRTRDLVGL